MQILFLLAFASTAFCLTVLAMAHQWPLFAIVFGLAVGCLWLYATEQRWSQRLHIQWLRLSMRLTVREIDRTTVEMTQAWQDSPGSDHWRALDSWLADLMIERFMLRQRIDKLTYELGANTF